ncbi:TetR/AcrR family transcriptional regulator [Paenibacillus kandeliae]|uniref:TetR/AcrR family transcriptional regulator n=1 Tax=Paenibacillus kandeliae TaxID=3231269 RepID=UPI00345949E3
MARKREFDEEQVLEQVMQLFWQKGYEATSMSDLTAATGLQKPSLYAAYGDKMSLFEKALRRYNEQHLAKIQQLLDTGKTAKQSFEQVFRYVLQSTIENKNNDKEKNKNKDNRKILQEAGKDHVDNQSISDYGCYCLNTLVELAPHHQTFAVLTREHQMKLGELFTQRLQQAIQHGEYAASYNASGHAQIMLVQMIGLTVLLKANPDPSIIQHSAATFLSSLLG